MKPFIKLILMIRLRRTGCNNMQWKPDLKGQALQKTQFNIQACAVPALHIYIFSI